MSRKGVPNKITDEQRAWAKRVDRMLAQGSPDKQEGFDRLICRLLTNGEEQTKIALIRLMIPYRHGLPRESHQHEHKHLHAEITVTDADSLIAGYLGAA